MKLPNAVAFALATAVAAETCIQYEDRACSAVQAEGFSCDLVDGHSNCDEYVWDLHSRLLDVRRVRSNDQDRRLNAARDVLSYLQNHYLDR